MEHNRNIVKAAFRSRLIRVPQGGQGGLTTLQLLRQNRVTLSIKSMNRKTGSPSAPWANVVVARLPNTACGAVMVTGRF
jgi:hypothetical protein